MLRPEQTTVNNWLLRTLEPASFERLSGHLQQVELTKGLVLIEPDRPPPFCTFHESGLGSVLAETGSGQSVEVGLYGLEGFTGIPTILRSVHSPHRLVMQIGGQGLRLPCQVFAKLLEEDSALQTLMQRYTQFFLIQVAQTCLSNALHPIDVRLARWLLMSHDRMPNGFVPLTQEYLSLMLGCNRTTVSTTIAGFADQGIVKTGRGSLEVLDRDALEDKAGEAYGLPEREYDRLISPFFRNIAAQRGVLRVA